MITLKPNMTCAYEGCAAPATHIACGRKPRSWHPEDVGHPNPNVYCEAHAEMVEAEGYPEYTEECPNCGCRFGVN